MAKRNLWKARCEKAKADLADAQGMFNLQGRMMADIESTCASQAATIAGLCDALRATAEQLEVRGVWDTARHIRKIADNYSPVGRAPVVFGLVDNIGAQLIDPPNLIYQVSNRAVVAVSAVYDRGIELRSDAPADYEDLRELTHARITPGRYATCLALGLFRLGARPDGIVTATVRAQ